MCKQCEQRLKISFIFVHDDLHTGQMKFMTVNSRDLYAIIV